MSLLYPLPSSEAPLNAPTGPKKTRFAATLSFGPLLEPPKDTRRRSRSSSTQRQVSNPVVRSALQYSIPPEVDMSKSAPNSPKSMAAEESPTRPSRLSLPGARPRGESRSSSVPIIIRASEDSEDDNNGSVYHSLSSRSQPNSRAASPEPAPGANQHGQDPRSVKHLTCFWWWEKGHCKHSDENCRK